MKCVASAIREVAPPAGIVATASGTVAKTLDAGGDYMKQQGVGGMCQDLAGVIRRHPLPALVVAMGTGFLVARATSRRRQS
jgi:hypothetical protein